MDLVSGRADVLGDGAGQGVVFFSDGNLRSKKVGFLFGQDTVSVVYCKYLWSILIIK